MEDNCLRFLLILKRFLCDQYFGHDVPTHIIRFSSTALSSFGSFGDSRSHRSIFGLYGRAIMRTFDYYMLYVRYRYHTHRKLFGLYGMAIMRTSYIHTSLYNFDKMVKKGKYSKIVSLYIVKSSFFDV